MSNSNVKTPNAQKSNEEFKGVWNLLFESLSGAIY